MADIGDRPSPYDRDVDDRVWSNMSINGKRLTWKEAADYYREKADQLAAWSTLMSDLDRCVHGRHQGDDCSGCGGPSVGNPAHPTGSVVGYGMDARPIVQPPRETRHKPEAWRLDY